MFLGYQEKIIGYKSKSVTDKFGVETVVETPITEEFIASIANTREELENNIFMKFSRIEETKDEYKLVDGKYISITEAFEKAKEAKRLEINAARDAAEQGGFEYMGKMFDSDQVSCQRISCAAQAMQLAMMTEDVPTITWTCQDNTTIELNPQELSGLVVALAEWSNTCHQKATRLKEQIDLAKTEEDLEKIQWNELIPLK